MDFKNVLRVLVPFGTGLGAGVSTTAIVPTSDTDLVALAVTSVVSTVVGWLSIGRGKVS